MGAADARTQPSPFGYFSRGCRFPQLCKGDAHAPLLRRERIEMALEVLRMHVDQVKQILHEPMQRAARAECGHDRDQPGATAGEDLQRPDLPRRRTLARHRLPESAAFRLVERRQHDHAEEVVQGSIRPVDLLETAGRGSQQHDPRLGLERFPQSPPRVRIQHARKHRVEVLNRDQQPFACTVGEVEQGAQAALGQQPVVVHRAQVLAGASQI